MAEFIFDEDLFRELVDQLEIENEKIAFSLCEGDPNNLVGYKHVGTHMIFDIKLGENFRRKAQLVIHVSIFKIMYRVGHKFWPGTKWPKMVMNPFCSNHFLF